MAANSQDPVVERVRGILQLPAEMAEADLESLFLEELRNRRERLAHWMQLIQEEARREAAAPYARSSRRHHCRTRASRTRLPR